MAPIVAGVDIGTTGTKVVAYDEDGRSHAHATREYPLRSPAPHAAEQDPEQVLEAVVAGLGEVARSCAASGRRVSGVCFSAAMHSVLGIDHAGTPLTPLYTWADARARPQADRLRAGEDGRAIYARTGTPLHPMAVVTKLAWLKEESPELFGRVTTWIGIKEFVVMRLLGELVVDHSIASATGLFDITRMCWDDGALAWVGLGAGDLPTPVETTRVFTGLHADYVDALALDRDTPFVVGASDGGLANLGVGATAPGVAACTIGTSGAIRMCADRPRVDPEERLFCYVLTEGLWLVGGPINNGGVALKWLRDNVLIDLSRQAVAGGKDAYTKLTELASTAPPGSEGLLFLPYLLGERAPIWNADARAAFVGLTIRHGREHLIRAVMEGVVFEILAVVRLVEELVGPLRELRATGGFSHSSLWRQIMADILQRQVLFPRDPESSALGAAILGMKALGIIDSVHASERIVAIARANDPVPDHAAVYEALSEVFSSVYPSLEPAFERLAALDSSKSTAAGPLHE